jgi:hypothetical protein
MANRAAIEEQAREEDEERARLMLESATGEAA